MSLTTSWDFQNVNIEIETSFWSLVDLIGSPGEMVLDLSWNLVLRVSSKFFQTTQGYYNFLVCDWFKNVLFSTNPLAKLLSDSLLSDSLISQSHSKM